MENTLYAYNASPSTHTPQRSVVWGNPPLIMDNPLWAVPATRTKQIEADIDPLAAEIDALPTYCPEDCGIGHS